MGRGEGASGSEWKTSRQGPGPKLIAAGAAGVLLLFFVLQNRDRADLEFLFWAGNFPLWTLALASAALGFAAGWLLSRISGKRRARRAAA
jgi:uncharacterized integral membrane protein